MNMRYIGIVIMVLSIFSAVTVYALSTSIIDFLDIDHSCSSYQTCPHVQTLNFSYTGYIFSAALFSVGLYIFMKAPQPFIKSKPKNLEPDENKVFELISGSGGMLFQSDLVEKTGFPKARVTRVLDKLEAKGVLDRRRRGMSNAVVLK